MKNNNDYSGNKYLYEISNKLNFKCKIFDDGDGVNLQNKAGNCDIDAIIYFKNLILLIEVYSGTNEGQADDKIKKLQIGLKDILCTKDMLSNLKVEGLKTKKVEKDKDLKLIFSNLKKQEKDKYNIIIKKIFFSPNLDIKIDTKDNYRKKDIFILDKEIFNYLNQIYETLDDKYSIREFLNFLNIQKIELEKNNPAYSGSPAQKKPMNVSSLDIEKGKIKMYSCPCLVSDIEELVTVFRPINKKYNTEGFQRMIKRDRIEKILSGYLKSNETFPNNIILALEPSLYKDEKDFIINNKNNQTQLKLYDEYNSLMIIDGQHRFFSLLKCKGERKILVTFVYYNNKIDKAILKMHETFYEINKKQDRIDPSLSFVLQAKINKESQESFWFDILKTLNNSSGFFKNKISFKEKQLRYKDEKSILSVITYGGLLKLNNKSKKIEGLEYFYGNKLSENKKFAANLLNNYFSIIQDELQKIGIKKENVSPRDIGALIRLVRHFMVSNKDRLKVLGDNVDIRKISNNTDLDYIKNIISYIDFKQISASQLSPSNWAAVEGLLLKHIHIKDKGFGSKNILSKKGSEIYNN